MQCEEILFDQCPQGHDRRWKCHSGVPSVCRDCEQEVKRAKKKQEREFAAQQKRQTEQKAHEERLARLDDELRKRTSELQDIAAAKDREAAIRQKEADLADLTTRLQKDTQKILSVKSANSKTPPPPSAVGKATTRVASSPIHVNAVPVTSITGTPDKHANCRDEWENQKTVNGDYNPPLDDIMNLVGLENVKRKILKIYNKLEILKKQNANLQKERLSVAMLGNPGTGILLAIKLFTILR
jgi:DNA repair exonuclease SbcCD ATPase subunit